MKFFILILCIVSVLQARLPEKGESVFVELKSGIRQKAEFAGFSADTVLLGGYIKNNYTIVKLPKSSFLHVIAESSGDTLTLFEESLVEIQDSLSSLDSTITDSLPKWQDTLSPFYDKTIIAPFNRRPIDSAFTENIQNIFFALFEEEKQMPILLPDSILKDCREISCILSFSKEHQSEGALFGTVLPGNNDSLRLDFTYFKKGLEPEEFSFQLPSRMPLTSSLEGTKIQEALQVLFKKEPTPKKEPDTVFLKPQFNHIYVESEPDGALLTLAKGNPICKTPCTYATKDTGDVELYAYWDVDEHLWAETIKTKILPNDTTKILMKLQRVQPKIQIISHPEGAEIYPNDSITNFSARLGKTPKILDKNFLGPTSIFLTKEGYKDTTIQLYIMPNEMNKAEIHLTPLTVPAEIEKQQEAFKERRHKKIGLTLIGSSIVPAIAGGVFAYLSAKDYEKAKEIRDELKEPHIADGENYNKQKKKNKEYAERSDERAYISITSFALAIGLLAAGITISF